MAPIEKCVFGTLSQYKNTFQWHIVGAVTKTIEFVQYVYMWLIISFCTLETMSISLGSTE